MTEEKSPIEDIEVSEPFPLGGDQSDEAKSQESKNLTEEDGEVVKSKPYEEADIKREKVDKIVELLEDPGLFNLSGIDLHRLRRAFKRFDSEK